MEPLSVTKARGGTVTFTVEVATDPKTQRDGLMYRKTLPEQTGMLFIFEGEVEHFFWMKNTLLPLDMIFIRADGIIHHIHEKAIPLDETPISSQGKVMAVLEINGGEAEKLGLKPGDRVNYPAFTEQP